MLKKVLKAVAALETRVKKSAGVRLSEGAPLSKKLQKAIIDLEARAKQHELAAITAREAAKNLRDLFRLGASRKKSVATKATRKTIIKSKRASTPVPHSTKKILENPEANSKSRPTLAAAIEHVLDTRRQQKAGGVKPTQLYVEVQQAGYKFGGANVVYRMNYLHKTLRQHRARFKKADDGTIALA